MAFSDVIIQLQKNKGLSNYRLAKDLGVHASTIQSWRNGKLPQTAHILKLAEYFNISTDELFGQKKISSK